MLAALNATSPASEAPQIAKAFARLIYGLSGVEHPMLR
jgi:hypothetical protein